MFTVLVVESGAIDYEMIREVLSENLEGPVKIVSAINSEDACTLMREHSIDLLIADVPATAAYIKNLVQTAYGLHKEIQVIITSVKSEDKIARLASKIDAAGYLLKPFRANDLVRMVLPLEKKSKVNRVHIVKEEQKNYLAKISSCIEECQYKQSIEIAKEYIDLLYESSDNRSLVRTKIVEFVVSIAILGQIHSKDTQMKLTICLERFRSRYDWQSNRFEVLSVIEELIEIIFAEMERFQLYGDDDIKKVLNYIDRNIKTGLTLDDAAEYINMSSSYFSKFFKKNTGTNFITYVTDRKIELAKEMLQNTNMPVINIAYALSYNETNYFCKAFKKKVGITPTEFRESSCKTTA